MNPVYQQITSVHYKSTAKAFAFIWVVEQHVLWVYHTGSYANQPIMLKSEKPMLMRDVFLTKCTAPVANPLSTLYVPYVWDMLWNVTFAWHAGMAMTPVIGFSHMMSCFFLGGFVSGFAYLFQGQLNPKRLRTQFDCNASSNGGWCAVAALGLTMKPETAKKMRGPAIFAHVPIKAACGVYILQALAQEFFPPLRDWYPKLMHVSSTQTGKNAEDRMFYNRKDNPRLTNWGCIGGIFFGLAYGALMFRMRADRRAFQGVVESVKGHAAGAALR
jgi:membrane associated rhomboid family serine protease